MDLISSILTQLGVNSSFLYQFFLVVICYFFLSNLVFKPLLKILQTRHQHTKGLKEHAEKLEKETQEMEEQYRVAWAKFAKEGQDLFSAGDVLAAREKARAMIEKAEKEANTKLTNARLQMEEVYKQADVEGDKYVSALATDVEKKLLERKDA